MPYYAPVRERLPPHPPLPPLPLCLCFMVVDTQALHMALALNHHKAYEGAESSGEGAYLGGGHEPGPAPSVRELVENCLRGRVDSDPEVQVLAFVFFVPLFFSVLV